MEESLYKSLVEAFVVVGVSCLNDMRPLPPIEGHAVAYEPHLLDCIPESRREDSIIRDISLFCLPEGVIISDHHGSPQGATFVLTDEVGNHWYGSCLRFYDTITQDVVIPKEIENALQSSSGGEGFTTSIITETTDTIVNVIKGSQAIREKKNNKSNDEEIQSTDDEDDSSNFKKLHPLFGDLSSQKTNYIERTNSNQSMHRVRGNSLIRTKSEDLDSSSNSIVEDEEYIPVNPWPEHLELRESKNHPTEKIESFYCSKCLCILSKLPFFDFFHEYLTQVYTCVFKDNQEGPTKRSSIPPIETYIGNLVLEIPIPPPGIDICFRVFGPIRPLLLSKPPLNELPSIQVSIRTIFLCLDKCNVISLITAILLERQILFTSKNNNLLTISAECIYNLTYPFFWKYVYIPVLPPNLIQCTEAPTPYIMGVDSKYLSWIDSSLPLVIVDLDNNILTVHGDPLPLLPANEKNKLLNEIAQHIHPELSEIGRVYPYGKPIRSPEEIEREEDFHERQIRLSFVEFFVSLFSGYRKYLLHNPDGITFDNEPFLKSKSDDMQAFLVPFLETNIFYSFLQEGMNQSIGLFHELLKRFEDNVPLSELRNGFEYYSPHLDVIIPMNNPREYKYTGEAHRSFSFPRFQKERGLEAPRFQLLLKKIDVIMTNHPNLPQLHLLKAQILSQLATSDSYYLMQAIQECIEALSLNVDILSTQEIESLLHLAPENELQMLSFECTVSRVKTVATSIYKARIEEKEKQKQKQKALEMKTISTPPPAISSSSNSNIITEEEELFESKDVQKILAILQSPFIPDEGMNRNFFLKLLKGSKILNDDNSLSKMNKYFKSIEVNNVIPVPIVKSLVSSIVKVYDDIFHYQQIFSSLLGAREIPIFFGPVSTFSGKNGKLLLTSTRLILFKKKRNPRYHNLQDIQSIEVFNYVIVFPPGVPCLKLHIPPKPKPFVYVFWNFSLRDLWGTYILETIAAYKICSLLRDKRIVDYSIQNILFSEALQKRDKRRSSKGALTYFGRFYPNQGWFKIANSLELKGMLNVSQEELMIEGEINDAMGVITSLLDNIAQLFFEFVEGDGCNVNFTELKRSIRWEGFLQLAASLQKVDVSKLATKEKTLLFINLYNIMVIHAYVICGSFPKSILDWRYIERCAYYSLGGVAYSLGDIHHGILRRNTKAPWDFEMPFGDSDHRKDQLHNIIFDNRVLFLLSTHLDFSPSMFKLNIECLEASFRVASEFYCQEHVNIDGNTISLPITLCWYKDDFGGTVNSVLKWTQSYLTTAKKKKIQQLLESSVYEVEWVEKWVPYPKPLLTGGMKITPNCYNYSVDK